MRTDSSRALSSYESTESDCKRDLEHISNMLAARRTDRKSPPVSPLSLQRAGMGTKRKQPDTANPRDSDGQTPASGIQALPLKPEALRKLEELLCFQNCVLILDDAEIPCHLLRLSEVSTVLR